MINNKLDLEMSLRNIHNFIIVVGEGIVLELEIKKFLIHIWSHRHY